LKKLRLRRNIIGEIEDAEELRLRKNITGKCSETSLE
jgi:hypothetical protein